MSDEFNGSVKGSSGSAEEIAEQIKQTVPPPGTSAKETAATKTANLSVEETPAPKTAIGSYVESSPLYKAFEAESEPRTAAYTASTASTSRAAAYTAPAATSGTYAAPAASEPRTTASTAHTTPAASSAPEPEPAYTYTTANPQGVKEKKKGTMSSGLKTFLLAFAGALVACGLFFGVAKGMGLLSTTTVVTNSNDGTQIAIQATGESLTLAEAVAQKCLPSVVNIDVYSNSSSYGYGYGYGNGGGDDELTMTSLGSGVILTSDGYVLTNYHVVEGASALKVTAEGEEYSADIVGYDESSDIAVIKLEDANGLRAIEVGDSDNLLIGEWVMTIGSPFGLEQSVATGIVSATNRSEVLASETGGESSVYVNMIQTDAAINPGNSGGALVNKDGQLIGINTLISSYSGSYSGVGFAIPINYAISLADTIIAGETPSHAYLGVSMSSVTPSIASRYGLAQNWGVYVANISPDSAAEEAGIQVGDIITRFNGEKVTSSSELLLAIRKCKVGDEVEIILNRDGQEITLNVVLGSDA